MFYKMLKHKNIKFFFKKKYKFSIADLDRYNSIIYTGPIDAFFNFKFGKLGWRSLNLIFLHIRKNIISTACK